MNRNQFITLTILSGGLAFLLFLQVVLGHINGNTADSLRAAEAKLQDGQLCIQHWQQIAQRVAQVSQQQNDQALKDVLTRAGLSVKTGTNAAPAPEAAPAPAPSTH